MRDLDVERRALYQQWLRPGPLDGSRLGEMAADVQSDTPHRPTSAFLTRGHPAGDTTTTDPRSKRNRASRRGGQLPRRTRGPKSYRPARSRWCPVSSPCPGAATIPVASSAGAEDESFHTRYHPFITDRPGDTLTLEADHRRHAEIENAIRDLKYGMGLNHLPSGKFAANAAWLAVQVIAHNLAR